MVKALCLKSVVSSVTRLVSMEANGVPFYSPPLPSLCQYSVLWIFKAVAIKITGKLKQTLKSSSIEPGTTCSKRRTLQGTKLTFYARSHLAPKFSKVVAKAKKLGAI